MEQTNLLLIAMAERCLKILKEKSDDDRFGLPASLRLNHLRNMCERIVEHAEDWPVSRSHRWIGFIQAGMIANYMLDLNGTKGMFSGLKEQFGAIADDQDLLDHLDPAASFEIETGGEG